MTVFPYIVGCGDKKIRCQDGHSYFFTQFHSQLFTIAPGTPVSEVTFLCKNHLAYREHSVDHKFKFQFLCHSFTFDISGFIHLNILAKHGSTLYWSIVTLSIHEVSFLNDLPAS